MEGEIGPHRAGHTVGPHTYLLSECLVLLPTAGPAGQGQGQWEGLGLPLAEIPERQMLALLHCIMSEHR